MGESGSTNRAMLTFHDTAFTSYRINPKGLSSLSESEDLWPKPSLARIRTGTDRDFFAALRMTGLPRIWFFARFAFPVFSAGL
jgi:hypothetical protein